MKKVEIRVGDIEEVEFLKNEKGGKPICKIDGVVGFITGKSKDLITPRSVWLVEISEVNARSLTVTPFEKIKTPYQNLKEIDKSISQLVPKKEKRKKVVKRYLYKTANERDNGKA